MLYGYLPQLISGLYVTLEITVLSLFLGILMAFLWFALSNIKFRPLRYLVIFITSFVRSLPELMMLFIIYFGGTIILSKVFGHYVDVSNFVAAFVALSLIFSSYFCEVLQTGYVAVDKNQLLAAEAYGFSKFQQYKRILLPLMLQHIMPGFSNLCLVLLKDTAIVSLIGTTDLMQVAHLASSATAKPFTFYLIAALVYLILTSIVSSILHVLNRKWGW